MSLTLQRERLEHYGHNGRETTTNDNETAHPWGYNPKIAKNKQIFEESEYLQVE